MTPSRSSRWGLHSPFFFLLSRNPTPQHSTRRPESFASYGPRRVRRVRRVKRKVFSIDSTSSPHRRPVRGRGFPPQFIRSPRDRASQGRFGVRDGLAQGAVSFSSEGRVEVTSIDDAEIALFVRGLVEFGVSLRGISRVFRSTAAVHNITTNGGKVLK